MCSLFHCIYEQVEKAYYDRVNLSAQGFFKTPGLDFEWNIGRGRPYRYYTYGVGCSEVQVDCLTGDFNVSSEWIVLLCSSNTCVRWVIHYLSELE